MVVTLVFVFVVVSLGLERIRCRIGIDATGFGPVMHFEFIAQRERRQSPHHRLVDLGKHPPFPEPAGQILDKWRDGSH
jgi:hypothetical protein